jgi:hypothetical protein
MSASLYICILTHCPHMHKLAVPQLAARHMAMLPPLKLALPSLCPEHAHAYCYNAKVFNSAPHRCSRSGAIINAATTRRGGNALLHHDHDMYISTDATLIACTTSHLGPADCSSARPSCQAILQLHVILRYAINLAATSQGALVKPKTCQPVACMSAARTRLPPCKLLPYHY